MKSFLYSVLFAAMGLLSLERAASQTPPSPVSPVTTYVLQAGDEIDIRVFELPDLNQTARIRPDGKISLLLLNDVEAAGRTPERLSEQLSLLYAKHFRSPQVAVIVRSFSNFSVYVGGEVGQPGMVPLGGDLTAASAIFRAGGSGRGASGFAFAGQRYPAEPRRRRPVAGGRVPV